MAISNQKPDGTVLKEDEHRYKSLRGNEGWHTDSSYMPLAAKASVLSAQVVPSADGETEWAGHLGQPLRAAPGAALRPPRATGDAAHARRGDPATELAPTDRDARAGAGEPSTSNRWTGTNVPVAYATAGPGPRPTSPTKRRALHDRAR